MTCHNPEVYATIGALPDRRMQLMNATCQWITDTTNPEKPVCGLTATTEVTVKTKITVAKVWLCPKHKREHDVSFAQARTERKKEKH